MALSTEEKQKPSLWNQALKAVKGESTNELVEQFTQEMTLVAEGLCEDQARLRNAVDSLKREAERQTSKEEQDYQDLLRRLEELSGRVSALEKPTKQRGRFSLGGDALHRLTILAAIVCGTWLIVTILNLFM